MLTVRVTTNTVSTAVCQIWVARHITSLLVATRAINRTAILVMLACRALAASGIAGCFCGLRNLLTVTLRLLTAPELLHSASARELSFDRAPAPAESRYQTFVNLGFAAAHVAGPAVILCAAVPHRCGDLAGPRLPISSVSELGGDSLPESNAGPTCRDPVTLLVGG